MMCTPLRKNCTLRRLLGCLLLLAVVSCSSDSKDSKNGSNKSAAKGNVRIAILSQDSNPEGLLTASIEQGITTAFAQFADDNQGFGGHGLEIKKINFSTLNSADELNAILDNSVAVFASLDADNSKLLAQTATLVATPILFVNDGPLRTCKPEAVTDLQLNLWQLGLTDAQVAEPFLIHLSEKLRKPDSPFRFSFFSSDALWPRVTTEFLIDNVEGLGFGLATEQYPDMRISDFYTPLRKVLRQPADIFFITPDPSLLDPLIQQSYKMLVHRDYTLSTLNLLPEESLSHYGEKINNLRTVSRFVPAISQSVPSQDAKVWSFKDVARLNTAAATSSYVGMQLLQKAATELKAIDAVSLNAGLVRVSLGSPKGTFWFSKTNHVLTQPLFGVVVQNGAYQDYSFLGDVEHPAMSRCAYEVLLPREKPSDKESEYE